MSRTLIAENNTTAKGKFMRSRVQDWCRAPGLKICSNVLTPLVCGGFWFWIAPGDNRTCIYIKGRNAVTVLGCIFVPLDLTIISLRNRD